jgi:hypothetical protein
MELEQAANQLEAFLIVLDDEDQLTIGKAGHDGAPGVIGAAVASV